LFNQSRALKAAGLALTVARLQKQNLPDFSGSAKNSQTIALSSTIPILFNTIYYKGILEYFCSEGAPSEQ